jgi:hypothetical protein
MCSMAYIFHLKIILQNPGNLYAMIE